AKSIVILIPSGSPNEHAARRAASQAVEELKLQGIGSHQIAINHYSAAGHGESATLRIVYSDLVAGVASQCGQWSEDIIATGQNRNYHNFGCATQNNIAAMLADPHDLIAPADETPPDSTARIRGVQAYREGSVTVSETDNNIKSQIAE
ncbi:MAG TPA: CpaD family pilus assembly protein, partial [Amphiplicatus sp.]|nr:CpaD family pilus assembly protein [Amphiplicatus sp.]